VGGAGGSGEAPTVTGVFTVEFKGRVPDNAAQPRSCRRTAGARSWPPRPLPASFGPWLDLSSDAEVLALFAEVKATLTRRGYVVALAVVKRW